MILPMMTASAALSLGDGKGIGAARSSNAKICRRPFASPVDPIMSTFIAPFAMGQSVSSRFAPH
jgi:hypothetical protein